MVRKWFNPKMDRECLQWPCGKKSGANVRRRSSSGNIHEPDEMQGKALLGRYTIVSKVGEGTYGKVELVLDSRCGRLVAVKSIRKKAIRTQIDLLHLRREVQLVSSMQHPNITQMFEVFESRANVMMVMEFAACGELYDFLARQKKLPETVIRKLFRQIVGAMYFCHKNHICHRDLKLENIFIDLNGNIKVGDFGLATVFDSQHLQTTFCGSPLYIAPEIVDSIPYHGPEVDIWSMGVILFTMVYDKMPFTGAYNDDLMDKIRVGYFVEPQKRSAASTLIRSMLVPDFRKRATIDDLVTHPWVDRGFNNPLISIADAWYRMSPVQLPELPKFHLRPSRLPLNDDELLRSLRGKSFHSLKSMTTGDRLNSTTFDRITVPDFSAKLVHKHHHSREAARPSEKSKRHRKPSTHKQYNIVDVVDSAEMKKIFLEPDKVTMPEDTLERVRVPSEEMLDEWDEHFKAHRRRREIRRQRAQQQQQQKHDASENDKDGKDTKDCRPYGHREYKLVEKSSEHWWNAANVQAPVKQESPHSEKGCNCETCTLRMKQKLAAQIHQEEVRLTAKINRAADRKAQRLLQQLQECEEPPYPTEDMAAAARRSGGQCHMPCFEIPRTSEPHSSGRAREHRHRGKTPDVEAPKRHIRESTFDGFGDAVLPHRLRSPRSPRFRTQKRSTNVNRHEAPRYACSSPPKPLMAPRGLSKYH